MKTILRHYNSLGLLLFFVSSLSSLPVFAENIEFPSLDKTSPYNEDNYACTIQFDNQNILNFTQNGGQQQFNMTFSGSCGGTMTFTNKPSWLTLYRSGSILYVTTSYNSGQDRSAQVNVNLGGGPAGIFYVSQEGETEPVPPNCTINGFNNTTFAGTLQTKTFTLSFQDSGCGTMPTFTFSAQGGPMPSWASATQGGNSTTVSVTLQPNYTGSSRSVDILGDHSSGKTIDALMTQPCWSGTWYKDSDGDGFAASTTTGCNPGTGYTRTVLPLGDCNDNNGDINPDTVWYKDADGDGFAASTTTSCNPGTGYTRMALPLGDCNDNNANINPDTIWYKDADNDGFAVTLVGCTNPGSGYGLTIILTPDCDDGDPNINPDTVWYADTDEDGFRDEGGASQQMCQKPGPKWTYNTSVDNCINQPSSTNNGCDANCNTMVLTDPAAQQPITTLNFTEDAGFDEPKFFAFDFPSGCTFPRTISYNIIYNDPAVTDWFEDIYIDPNLDEFRIYLKSNPDEARGASLQILVNGEYADNGGLIYIAQDGTPPPADCVSISGFNDTTFSSLGTEQTFMISYTDGNCAQNLPTFTDFTDQGGPLPSWVQNISQSANNIHITLEPNHTGSDRSVEILSDSNGSTISATITQLCHVGTWYKDNDGDGYGVSSLPDVCYPGLGYTLNIIAVGDCDDDNKKINPGTVWYLDADNDDHAISTMVSCTSPGAEYTTTILPVDDCDDTNENVTGVLYSDADGDGLGDPNDSMVYCGELAGYVANSSDLCPGITSNSNECDGPLSSNPVDHNYVYTRIYQTERLSATSNFFDTDAGLIQEITYFDGLGRPIQQIGLEQSPIDATIKRDIVAHIGYDDYGRQDKDWLPVPIANSSFGSYHGDISGTAQTYYKTHLDYGHDFPTLSGTDVNAYSEKHFEPSPLNRVLKQSAPGEDWKLNLTGDDHSIEFEYLTNKQGDSDTFNAADDNVRLFNVTTVFADNTYTPTLVLDTDSSTPQTEFYDQGELFKNVTKDENHDAADGKLHTTEEFTDKQGRVVLKRTYADIPAMDIDGNSMADPGEEAIPQAPHDTYYVYDDFGNLTYVLPPQVNTADGVDAIELKELCYQYIYDHRNRLVQKQLPGKEKEYIVYNKLDQPVLTQDANQRENNEWLFTKYDAFGRVVYTGIYTDAINTDRGPVQADLDKHYTDNANALLYEKRDNANTANHQYTNTSYPTTNIEVFTVNYYDSYGFSFAASTNPGTVFQKEISAQTKGLATGSKIKVLTTDSWINSVSYYDAKGRPIYSYSENDYLETVDVVETQLDFVGKPLKVKTTHTRGGDSIVTIDNFSYDHVGRLLAQTQCIGNENMGDSCPNGVVNNTPLQLTGTIDTDQPNGNSITVGPLANIIPGSDGSTTLRISNGTLQELIVFNNYDELGQLANKKVGGAPESAYTNTPGLQEVNYKYNVRGWLTNINDISDATPDKLFNFKIGYTDGDMPLYNGNISNTQWRTDNLDNTLKTYQYSYDPLNRITSATDGTQEDRYGLRYVGYDRNGNIDSLVRNGYQGSGGFADMDILDYRYRDDSNKLARVTDTGNAAHGFLDGTNTGDDFEYDINGNLEVDRNKGITSITYNHLNLPEQVNFGSDNIRYVYDAYGTRLKKTVSTGSETLYSGNHVYAGPIDGAQLQFFGHPEGYVYPDANGNYRYVYNYLDHLGSVRLSYTDADGDGNIDSDNEIIEENNYYPFGLKREENGPVSSLGSSTAKKWKYGNEEFEEDLGKNTVAYQWRDYDPTIARFNKIDRFAGKYQSITPYGFAANNPIFYREIQGDSIDVSQIVQYDNDNGTDILGKIKNDLSTATGLSFGLNNGKLVYNTDDDGNAIIATDGDGNQLGSSEARGIVTGALDAKEIATAKIVDSGGSRVTNDLGENEIGGNNINLDVNQIRDQFIGGARDVDSRTMGFGMVFMHESLHSNVAEGGAQRDFVGQTNIDVRTGPVVDRMNIVRGQLNSQGLNFGIRQTYGARNFTSQGQTTNTILFGGNIRTVHPRPLTNGGFLGPRIQY